MNTTLKSLMLTLAMLAPHPACADDPPAIERGRYVVKTDGCKNGQTAGDPHSGGKVPEAQTATRRASHRPATTAMTRCGADFAPVQFGTAVRKNPPRAAAP